MSGEQKWPNFPLWWLNESERNIEGLAKIAFHLQTKTGQTQQRMSTGFRGTPTEMEAQIIATLTSLQEQVVVLTDVVQSSLQIIVADYEHRKHRGRRAIASVRGKILQWERTLVGNWIYRILAIISTLAILGWLSGAGRWAISHLIRR